MPNRDQVLELLDHGHSYETAARELGIPAGQVFMIATGMPADGSGNPPRDLLDEHALHLLPGSPQQLVNPPPFNPTHNDDVLDWVRERAARELKQGK